MEYENIVIYRKPVDRSIEQMMKGIPNFYPRGSGIVVTGNLF